MRGPAAFLWLEASLVSALVLAGTGSRPQKGRQLLLSDGKARGDE